MTPGATEITVARGACRATCLWLPAFAICTPRPDWDMQLLQPRRNAAEGYSLLNVSIILACWNTASLAATVDDMASGTDPHG